MKVTTEPSNECRRLLEENMNWTPGCLGTLGLDMPLKKPIPCGQVPCGPPEIKKMWVPPVRGTKVRFWDGRVGYTTYRDGKPFAFGTEFGGLTRELLQTNEGVCCYGGWSVVDDARIAKINAFYKMCCKDGGRKIKDPLPDSDLQFWGDAMTAVEKNYTERGHQQIARVYVPHVSSPFYSPWDVGCRDDTPNTEVVRRRRIKYTRALFCKNKDTAHLKESGWAFWEKVMQNLDDRYAKKDVSTIEWKTTRPLSSKQYDTYSKFLRDFQLPTKIGIDYAKGPDKTGLFVGVVDAAAANSRIDELESENEILKGKLKAAETQRLDTQNDIRLLLEDVAWFVMMDDAKVSGRDHEKRLRKLAGLSE
jgi:hypothetical protein